jgi:cytochrome oxidase Cu insertion factor (SCO1/SenC/PrrC family)
MVMKESKSMIRKVLGLIILIAATVTVAAAQSAPTQSAPTKPATPPPAPHTNLKVGDPAPDFTLPSTIVQDGKRVRYTLSDFKGKKNVVLAFYVFAFTGG